MKYLQKKRVLNAGHPRGFWGTVTLKNMNNDHAKLAEEGLSHIDISKEDICLDIGCGGGHTVKKLSKRSDGKIYGIDISSTSVKISIKHNKEEIKSGRVAIRKGSAAAIPFPDESFDVITAVETFYFWKDKQTCLNNIYKALKDGGRFAIMLDDYEDGTDRLKEVREKLPDFELNTISDIEKMLFGAGFSDVKCHYVGKGICVVAYKAKEEKVGL